MVYYDTLTRTATDIESATTIPSNDVRVAVFFQPLPAGKKLDYTAEGLPLIVDIPEPTQAELAQQAQDQAKLARDIAVAGITVTTTAGNTFDGDEKAQSRMSRSIVSLTSGFNGTTKQWKLADNTWATVTAAELQEALTLASLAQDAIWGQ